MKGRTRIMSPEIAMSMWQFLEILWPDVEFVIDKGCVKHNSKDSSVDKAIYDFSEVFCSGHRDGKENRFPVQLSTGYQIGYAIGNALYKSCKFIESAKKNKLPLS